jgi:hypothetical protein
MISGTTYPKAISIAWLEIRSLALACNPQKTSRRVNLTLKQRISGLLAVAVLGASQVTAVPAYADEEQLQRQIDAMKRQLEAMQRELSQTKKQAAQQRPGAVHQQATAAPSQAVVARNGNEIIIPPPPPATGAPMPTKGLPSWFDGIHVSMAGSFVAIDGAWREHSEVSNGASDPPFANPGIPLQNSALWNEREFRMSAQQSRIALKINGDIDPNQHLKAYYEMDFLGASTDANNRSSNSFTPRLRQAYVQYDNDVYHFHAVAGQAWSLLTQNRVGMLPGTENTTLAIDAADVAGFNWARNPQLRFVYDWDKFAWFGLSIEQPATVFPGGVSAGTVSPPAPIVTSIHNNCTGASHLNGTTTCSNDIAPDIIEKFALDPGLGHYEVFGLQRWFTDQVANSTIPNSWSQKTTFAWGVGGSVLLPVIPKLLELQGSVMYGQGVGRYMPSQLPDAVVGPNGALTPVTGLSFLVGAVAHPIEGNDIYFYYGQDQSYANSWTVATAQGGTVTTTQGGWGNPNFVNNGCVNQDLTGGTLGAFNTPIAGLACTFHVQKAQEFTIGFWQDLYKGDVGRVRAGLQYEYVKLTAFPGMPTGTGTPNVGLTPNNNIAFVSLRYYPFN